MSLASASVAPERPAASPVGWTTVGVLAVVMAFADGFVLTSVQGAVGAVDRAQHPFASWLWTSSITVPVFALAVLGAVRVARRWFGPALRSPLRVVAAALLIVLAGSAVGTTELVVSAAYDYDRQSGTTTSMTMIQPPVTPDGSVDACTGMCEALRSQYELGQRAARLGSALVLGVNLVLVGWVVALRGGRLERRRG